MAGGVGLVRGRRVMVDVDGGGDLVLVRLAAGTLTIIGKLETTGEVGTLLSMEPCCTELEVTVGINNVVIVVGDGTGKRRLVVVFKTPGYVNREGYTAQFQLHKSINISARLIC